MPLRVLVNLDFQGKQDNATVSEGVVKENL